MAFFSAVCERPQSLRHYEQQCREATDPEEKEKIALNAVAFLINTAIPPSLSRQIDSLADKENLSLPAGVRLFPNLPAVLNDSLAGWYDGLLAENLPKLFWRRRHHPDSVDGENLASAKQVAAQLDTFLNFSYWTPLITYGEHADGAAWRNWRTAAVAASISRGYLVDSKFDLARLAAIYGLQRGHEVPDGRQKLELYLRLQNALVEGSESVFNLGFALADWISRESRRTGYFLRVVSAEFNCGNQLYLLGHFDDALEKFKKVEAHTKQWRHFAYVSWYDTQVLERITATLWELGDYEGMMKYSRRYSELAHDTRSTTLAHLNHGLAARLIGDFTQAEDEFKAAIKHGNTKDHLNVWYAYLQLGELYLEYNLPAEALQHFQAAKAYADTIANFLTGARLSEYWLYLARAYVQKTDMPAAQKALTDAEREFIDSPVLRVKSYFSAARVYESLGQLQEAAGRLQEARALCQKYGMTIHEINAILQQMALSFQTPQPASPLDNQAAELENLIAWVNKSGGRQQLVHLLALAVESASRAGRYDQAQQYANWLLQETEILSRLYEQEKRLIFFQHSIYEDVKAAIGLDLRLGKKDSAWVKFDYLKSRALQRRLNGGRPHSSYAVIANIQQQLQTDEAIVDYMVTGDTLYAFVLTAAQLEVFPVAVTRQELRALVQDYLVELAPAERRQNAPEAQQQQKNFLTAIQLSHRLYTKLINEIAAPLAKSKRLYIVPDEFLHLLPFNTLARQDSLAPEFLINRFAVMYLPAASLLAIANTSSKAAAAPLPAVLASIDSTLPGADKICAQLRRLQNTKVTIRTQWENHAAIANYCAQGFQTYFFYAHAEANWEDPWRSYIQIPLQPPQPPGKLTYADVDSIAWQRAGLVILAGCETAGNRIYGGAGLSGLQRSFLGAGVKQVLATFWKVDAAHVTSQMPDFFEEWDRSGDAALALQKMQQLAITKLKNNPYLNYPHPRYWGAYNLTGMRAAAAASSSAARASR